MKIRKNDQVLVTSGKERGKRGKVMALSPKSNQVLIERVNYKTTYLRRSQQNPQGGITQMEGYLALANVKLICPRCGKPTRVGYSRLADGTKQRLCKKCKEIF